VWAASSICANDVIAKEPENPRAVRQGSKTAPAGPGGVRIPVMGKMKSRT
jgi:hypothetical protein